MILKYLVVFIIFSILGWIYEYTVWNKSKPDGITKTLFHVDIKALPIYGVGAIILLFIYDNLKEYSLLHKVILAALFINIMECILGLCSYKFYGYQTWKYNSELCYGYISLPTAIFWTFCSFIFFILMDKISSKISSTSPVKNI